MLSFALPGHKPVRTFFASVSSECAEPLIRAGLLRALSLAGASFDFFPDTLPVPWNLIFFRTLFFPDRPAR